MGQGVKPVAVEPLVTTGCGRELCCSIRCMQIYARLAAAIVLAVCLGQLSAQEAPPAEIPSAVQALAAAQAGVTSLQGSFRWLTLPADGGEARERRGTFQLVRAVGGAGHRFNVTTSDLEGADIHRWCSNGIDRWEIEQQVPEEAPVKRKLEAGARQLDLDRIVACLLIDLPSLQRDFAMQVPVDEPRRIVLVPRREELQRDVRQLEVLIVADQPSAVVISEPNGNRIRLVVGEITRNQAIPEVYFNPDLVAAP
jgi:hypothetical protein